MKITKSKYRSRIGLPCLHRRQCQTTLTRRAQRPGCNICPYKSIKVGGSRTIKHSVGKHKCLELNVSSYRQPVDVHKKRGDVCPLRLVEHQTRRHVLDLETYYTDNWETFRLAFNLR